MDILDSFLVLEEMCLVFHAKNLFFVGGLYEVEEVPLYS